MAQPRTPDLEQLLSDIRSLVLDSPPAWYPAMTEALGRVLPDPLDPHVLLPVVGCCAAGGRPEEALELAAAWTLISASIRIMDDCADQDSPTGLNVSLGTGRAFNVGAGLLMLAAARLEDLDAAPHRVRAIVKDYAWTFLRMSAGQDRDLSQQPHDLESYLRLIEDKTACGYAFGCAAGARLVSDDVEIIGACHLSGHHVGVVLQLLDDLEALWFPDGPSDLAQGKLTFPIFYALRRPTAETAGLCQILARDEPPVTYEAAILKVLDAMNIRTHVAWAAIKERDRALAMLEPCPDPTGAAILDLYMGWVFRDLEALVDDAPDAEPHREAEDHG